MEDKILKRIQGLASELEKLVVERENHISALRAADIRIKELSTTIIELKKLLE